MLLYDWSMSGAKTETPWNPRKVQFFAPSLASEHAPSTSLLCSMVLRLKPTMANVLAENNASPGSVSPSAPVTSPSVEGKKLKSERGSGYTPCEVAATAKAWITVSENAIVSTGQKSIDFFASIANIYNENFKPGTREERTVASVKARCKAIQKGCMLFSGCYARVARFKPTGMSLQDMIRMSTGLFNGIDIGRVDDDCGKPLRFQQVWDVLRHHEKFMYGLSLPPKAHTADPGISAEVTRSTNEDAASTVGVKHEEKHSTSGSARPTKRKRAKEKMRKDRDAAKKMNLAAESVAAQVERNVALERHYEIMLFTTARRMQ